MNTSVTKGIPKNKTYSRNKLPKIAFHNSGSIFSLDT